MVKNALASFSPVKKQKMKKDMEEHALALYSPEKKKRASTTNALASFSPVKKEKMKKDSEEDAPEKKKKKRASTAYKKGARTTKRLQIASEMRDMEETIVRLEARVKEMESVVEPADDGRKHQRNTDMDNIICLEARVKEMECRAKEMEAVAATARVKEMRMEAELKQRQCQLDVLTAEIEKRNTDIDNVIRLDARVKEMEAVVETGRVKEMRMEAELMQRRCKLDVLASEIDKCNKARLAAETRWPYKLR